MHATQPRCYGDKATILVANNVRPQYKLICICKAVELSEYLGLITAEKNHTFVNVSPGRYNITTTTDDGCTETRAIEIIEPTQTTAAITKSLTCTDE
jgi:hypothetical protein